MKGNYRCFDGEQRVRTKPFYELFNDIPVPARGVIRVAIWLGLLAIYLCCDILRWVGIMLHDFGEWLLTVVVDESYIRFWWDMRKKVF